VNQPKAARFSYVLEIGVGFFMELDELVTKIINHIDDTKKDTIKEVKSLIDESVARSKTEILREVNVLLEEQRAQFNTFGEGLDTLRDQMNRRFDEVNQRFDKNDSEHQSMKLMIQESWRWIKQN
jgi:hypothetical protein